jgi:hypothetical protein
MSDKSDNSLIEGNMNDVDQIKKVIDRIDDMRSKIIKLEKKLDQYIEKAEDTKFINYTNNRQDVEYDLKITRDQEIIQLRKILRKKDSLINDLSKSIKDLDDLKVQESKFKGIHISRFSLNSIKNNEASKRTFKKLLASSKIFRYFFFKATALIIKRQHWFDEDYYLKNNSDVKKSSIYHFLSCGFSEGRPYSINFNLADYVDKEQCIGNPFLHRAYRNTIFRRFFK